MSVVIIPAYKPDERLTDIVNRLWEYGCEIIVVDDGSGGEYTKIFEKIRDVCIVLHHYENKGKGAAIKTALHYIRRELWMIQTIGIMDADGQHLPEDMIKLLEYSETHGSELVLGVRKVGKEMPLKSRLGNQITRTIFRLISGVQVSDTQTGLRAFGRELLEKMYAVRGERYEYEMNVLMEMTRAGIPVKEIPVSTIYQDKENSTSHFRVIRDSVRIYKDLLTFTLSSLSSFLLDYFLFAVFMLFLPHTGGLVILANILARMVSAFYNYGMNCKFVFHTRWQTGTAIDYFALACGILLMNNLVLGVLTQGFGIPVYGAKLMTECVLFFMSWLVQNRFIFRKRQNNRLKVKGRAKV